MLNNLTMFLRYDKVCVTLLTERDGGRYVNVLKLNETTIGTWHFCNRRRRRWVHNISAIARDYDLSILRHDRTSYQTISVKLKCSVKCDANRSVSVNFEIFTCKSIVVHWKVGIRDIIAKKRLKLLNYSNLEFCNATNNMSIYMMAL